MKRDKQWLGLAIGSVLILAGMAFAKSKKVQDFPDYNRVEYTKERPPAEQQASESGPGSINMRIGEKKADLNYVPLEEIPVALHKAVKENPSEPPMDFMETPPTQTEAPAVSTSTTATAPIQ